MSGVIDGNGQQWEHCNVCGGWVRFQDLVYEQPSAEHECGRDLCAKCAALPAGEQAVIAAAATEVWYAQQLARYAKMGWEVERRPAEEGGGIRILSCGGR